jgi:hypothetical protein
MTRIGLRPGESFDPGQLDPKTRAALDTVPKAAQDLMTRVTPQLAKVSNGWSMNTDTMGYTATSTSSGLSSPGWDWEPTSRQPDQPVRDRRP